MPVAGLTFADMVRGRTWPTSFRAIVVAETTEIENPRTFQTESRERFCAVALEWYVVGTGDTIEAALRQLELQVIATAVIHTEYPDTAPPKPAPEDYQRLATSGDRHIFVNPVWRELVGEDGLPVVHRATIDMLQSQAQVTRRP